MHLLAQEEYGLRCLVQLARHRGSSPLTILEIAAAEGLSPDYTAKLMRALRQGGLVMSTRGAAGGYRLARPAEEITLLEVLESLEGSLAPIECVNEAPGSEAGGLCGQQWVWQEIYADMRERLAGTTLQDLVAHEREHERQAATTYSI